MTDTLKDCNTDSEEYQQRYIQYLVNKGLPQDFAEEDCKAWIEGVIIDVEERNPEEDAEESLSYWYD